MGLAVRSRMKNCQRFMKIPKKLKIGGHVYKIEYGKDGNLGDVLCGKTHTTKGIIALNKSLIQSEMEATLFHEIFHVINNQFTEVTVESLSQQLYQVLKDNKLLKE